MEVVEVGRRGYRTGGGATYRGEEVGVVEVVEVLYGGAGVGPSKSRSVSA